MQALRTIALGIALVLPVAALAQSDDPVLAENGVAQVRRSDLAIELTRIPADQRDTFASSARRLQETVRRLLVERTLAQQARAAKLDRDPDIAAKLAAAQERTMAELFVLRIEERAGAEFDAALPSWEARARELYVVDAQKYETGELVSASHVLIRAQGRSDADARRLAEDIRAKAASGADFAGLALEYSEDASAKTNKGSLGWFPRAAMDPAFADAAFRLAKTGDLSEPVKSSFGWHVIRLDGRRASTKRPFDEVRAEILAELRKQYINKMREEALATARSPAVKMNEEAISLMVTRPLVPAGIIPSPPPPR